VLRTIPSAAALSASTGVTAQDRVDRLEARTAFRVPEPDAQPGAVAVVEPGAQQAAVVVAAEPGAPREAVAEPDAQPEAAAGPDAAVVAVPDARQEAAAVAEPDAQLEAAVALDAQQPAVLAPTVGAVKLRVRPLAASVELAQTAAVRLSIRPVLFSAPALGPALVSVAKERAAADR